MAMTAKDWEAYEAEQKRIEEEISAWVKRYLSTLPTSKSDNKYWTDGKVAYARTCEDAEVLADLVDDSTDSMASFITQIEDDLYEVSFDG